MTTTVVQLDEKLDCYTKEVRKYDEGAFTCKEEKVEGDKRWKYKKFSRPFMSLKVDLISVRTLRQKKRQQCCFAI